MSASGTFLLPSPKFRANQRQLGSNPENGVLFGTDLVGIVESAIFRQHVPSGLVLGQAVLGWLK
jgi:hypothetical protein